MNKKDRDIIKDFLNIEEIAHEYAIDTLKDIIVLLMNAEKTTKETILKWRKKFSNKGVLTADDVKEVLNKKELREFKKLLRKYISECEIYDLYDEYMEELEELVGLNRISILKTIEIVLRHSNYVAYSRIKDIVYDMVRKVYSNSYYKTAYNIQKYQCNWFNIDEVNIKELLAISFLYSYWTRDKNNFADRIDKIMSEHNVKIYDTILKSVVYERPIEDTFKKVSNIYNIDKSKLGRLVRTEEAYSNAIAQYKAYKNFNIEEYQIIAVIDNRTSDICRFYNNKRFKVKDFKVGYTAPPFHPNCRSTTRPYIYRKNFDEFKLINFKEWKEKYVKGASK